MKEPKAACAGCGAEQPYGQIRCDVCGEPLVFPTSFVCPRCGAESFNLNDIVERYCGRCHQFVDDFSVVMESLGLSFPEAVEWLARERKRPN